MGVYMYIHQFLKINISVCVCVYIYTMVYIDIWYIYRHTFILRMIHVIVGN